MNSKQAEDRGSEGAYYSFKQVICLLVFFTKLIYDFITIQS